jgi:AcrR family transcriptional regulator
MADIGTAAGVSRQTVYVQFGSRAGLLVAMVRHRDATNPDRPSILRAFEIAEPVEALKGFVVSLSRRWPGVHPVAQALSAAAVSDPDARAAWEDRMGLVHARARRVTDLLAAHQLLAEGWTPATAADWLWSVVHPLSWLQLVHDRGWSQRQYEQRLLMITRRVLVRDDAAKGRRARKG